MFFTGFFTGIITTIIVGFVGNFYKKSERKDSLLADLNNVEFEENITLKKKKK